MAVKPKKILVTTPAEKSSVLEKFFKEKPQNAPADNTAEQVCITCDIPIYNIRWYPSNKSCVKISSHRKPQNTPPLMVRKAEWRR
jgi:hypothetical protein